jgi:hypothetical protein
LAVGIGSSAEGGPQSLELGGGVGGQPAVSAEGEFEVLAGGQFQEASAFGQVVEETQAAGGQLAAQIGEVLGAGEAGVDLAANGGRQPAAMEGVDFMSGR